MLKRARFLLTLLNIIMIVSLMSYVIYNSRYGLALYWVLCLFIIFLIAWINCYLSKDGLGIDKKESKAIINSYNDITVTVNVLYILGFLTLYFLNEINVNVLDNIYIIWVAFLFTILVEIINIAVIYGTQKQMIKLAEKKYKQK